MRVKAFLTALCVTVASQASAQSGDNVEPHVIDDEYFVDELDWNRGPSNVVYITVLEQSGRYVVCAATQRVTRNHHRQAMRAIKVLLNGQVMLRGIHWAPNYNSTGSLVGREARCRMTDFAVVDNPQFGLDMARTRF